MEDFVRENPFLSCLLVLFAFEQLAYLFVGSYVYRFGLRLQTEELADIKSIKDWKEQETTSGIKSGISPDRGEAYLRPRYPALTWGPILFSSQIITMNAGKVITRMGPASSALVIYLFAVSVLGDGGWGFINGIIVVVVVGWLYMTFRRKRLLFLEQVRRKG